MLNKLKIFCAALSLGVICLSGDAKEMCPANPVDFEGPPEKCDECRQSAHKTESELFLKLCKEGAKNSQKESAEAHELTHSRLNEATATTDAWSTKCKQIDKKEGRMSYDLGPRPTC